MFGITKWLIKNIDRKDFLDQELKAREEMKDKIISIQMNMADKLKPKWHRSKKDRCLQKPKWLFQTNLY